jgi:hypothetical protein
VELGRVGLAERAAQDAAVADPAHERTRVDLLEGDDALLGEPGGERRPRAADDRPLALDALRLEARRVDPVVADERVAEAEHLRHVARIRYGLLVAGHRRGEAGLAGRDSRGADGATGEDGAVLENEMRDSVLHDLLDYA